MPFPTAPSLRFLLFTMSAGLLLFTSTSRGAEESNGTCMSEWMKRAGIPPHSANKFEKVLRFTRADEQKLHQVDVMFLAFAFDGNISYARALKNCLTRKAEQCRTFNPCQRGGRCDFKRKRNRNVCSCRSGLQGDICSKDCDECSGQCGLQHDCHRKYGQCTNIHGSYQCTCKTGFNGNGVNCTDVDECRDESDHCHGNANCSNTIGSYACKCKQGFVGNGLNCSDCDECSGQCGIQLKCHRKYGKCINTHGSYRCSCTVGFKGNGVTCSDMDECVGKTFHCHGNATCVNNIGSYSCKCKSGFTGNGKQCTDICDCCSSPCKHGGTCMEKVSGYSCHCSVGYEGETCQTRWLVVDKHKSLPDIVSNLTNAIQKVSEDVKKLSSSFYKLSDTVQSQTHVFQNLSNSVQTMNQRSCGGYVCTIHGRCVQEGNNFQCVCERNYYGQHCQINCLSGAKYSLHQKTCTCKTAGYVVSNGSCVPGPPECSSYLTLSQQWRNYRSGGGSHCDQSTFSPGWYRFTGAAGSRIATHCVPTNHCGTKAPMHMTGVHPTMADEVFSWKACAHWSGSCCRWSTTIKVRLCPGNFYVYYLTETPECDLAYCGSG